MSTQLNNEPYVIGLESRGMSSYIQYTGDAHSDDLLYAMEEAANQLVRRIKDAVTAWYGLGGICVLVMPKGNGTESDIHAKGDTVYIGSEAASIATAALTAKYQHPFGKPVIFRAVVMNVDKKLAVKSLGNFQYRNMGSFLQRLTAVHFGQKFVRGKSNSEMTEALSSLGISPETDYAPAAFMGAMINTEAVAPSQLVRDQNNARWINSFRSSKELTSFIYDNHELVESYFNKR